MSESRLPQTNGRRALLVQDASRFESCGVGASQTDDQVYLRADPVDESRAAKSAILLSDAAESIEKNSLHSRTLSEEFFVAHEPSPAMVVLAYGRDHCAQDQRSQVTLFGNRRCSASCFVLGTPLFVGFSQALRRKSVMLYRNASTWSFPASAQFSRNHASVAGALA